MSGKRDDLEVVVGADLGGLQTDLRQGVNYVRDLAVLTARGRDKEYTDLKRARVSAILTGCGFVHASDLSAEKLERFPESLRKGDVAPPLRSGRNPPNRRSCRFRPRTITFKPSRNCASGGCRTNGLNATRLPRSGRATLSGIGGTFAVC